MPIHVAIDVRHIRDFGIGTHIRNLLAGLGRLDREDRYTLIARPADLELLAGLPPNFTPLAYDRSDRGLLNNIAFPVFASRIAADVYHIPLNSVAYWMRRPYIVTVHDLSSVLFPERRDVRGSLHDIRFRRGVARAERVLTVSSSTRRDVENLLGVPPERIRLVGNAPDPAFAAAGELDWRRAQSTLERYQVNYPFVLYAGNIRPHKNVPRLVEAFAVLRGQLENHPVYGDVRLIIIGDEISKYPSVRRAVVQTRVQGAVRFLGFVPSETLCIFYTAASVFAFPSLYEGFGLPPLEAMACGTPVVASNIPALAEAVGDAAMLVNPENVFDIARGLREVLLDEDLRRRLVERGRRQLTRFSWDATAQTVLAAYLEVARKPSYSPTASAAPQ